MKASNKYLLIIFFMVFSLLELSNWINISNYSR